MTGRIKAGLQLITGTNNGKFRLQLQCKSSRERLFEIELDKEQFFDLMRGHDTLVEVECGNLANAGKTKIWKELNLIYSGEENKKSYREFAEKWISIHCPGWQLDDSFNSKDTRIGNYLNFNIKRYE